MKNFLPKSFTVLFLIAGSVAGSAQEVNDEPLTDNWAPSEWGPDDRIGAVNRTSPEIVMKAVGLVTQGKVATLGKIYATDMPLLYPRSYKLTIPGLPTGDPLGPQRAVWNDELVTAEIGQIGTQFDGPGHIGVLTSKGHYYYNGRFLEDPDITSYGLGPLGVEHVAQKGFVCRGVLLDAVALRGDTLPIPVAQDKDDPGIVTDTDIDEMIARQGIDPIAEGDCVFLHTGHGNIWHPRNWDSYDPAEKARRTAAFSAGAPGFGLSACEYLASRKIILTGADSWATEAIGANFSGEGPQPFECHIKLQAKRGIWNIENLDLTQLVEDKAYEFLFVWSPLKLKGATGSPGNPVAIY